LITLTRGFRVIKATLDDVLRLTRWTCYTVWPAQLPDSLITLHLIDQMLDIDLHHWTPARGWKMGWHEYMTASHSTTLESNKSVPFLQQICRKTQANLQVNLRLRASTRRMFMVSDVAHGVFKRLWTWKAVYCRHAIARLCPSKCSGLSSGRRGWDN